jgi:hypothetical protein
MEGAATTREKNREPINKKRGELEKMRKECGVLSVGCWYLALEHKRTDGELMNGFG